MRRSHKCAWVLLAALACGCDKDEPVKPAPAPSARMAEHPPIDRRSTPGQLAVHNLDEGLKQVEAGLKKNPKSVPQRETLVTVLLQRASFLGKIRDLKRALALGEETVTLEPENVRAFRMRARVFAAVHRFDEALADLDKAETLGASVNDTRTPRGTCLMGLGKYDEAFKLLHEHRTKFEDSTSLSLEAAVLGRMGKDDEADKLFAKAVEKYRGTSPFGIAWIYFEHGSMWDRAGDADRARALYKKAVDKLPMYAHAVGHLAALSPPKEAHTLLESIIKVSDDPEYDAMMGSALDKSHPGAGKSSLDTAAKGYERLMKDLPLAFADHAGWFYLDALKDAERAVEVAEMNLKAREVPEAYELAIAALLGAGDKDEACQTAERALRLKYPTRGMKARVAEAFEACGRKDKAGEIKKELAETRPRAKH